MRPMQESSEFSDENLFVIDDGKSEFIPENEKEIGDVVDKTKSLKKEEEWKDADFLSFESDGEKKNKNAEVLPLSTSTPPVTIIDRISLSNILGTTKVPPWISSERQRIQNNVGGYVPPLISLHNEIVDFVELIQPHESERRQRNKLLEEFKSVAYDAFEGYENIEITVFGSHATGLFLPTSDIDVVIFTKDSGKEKKGHHEQSEPSPSKSDATNTSMNDLTTKEIECREMEDWKIPDATIESPLKRLAEAVKEAWGDELENLEVLERTAVPLVKLTRGGVCMDISFNQEGGPEAAEIMNKFLCEMPPLRPLVFVLKYFMEIRGLNKPYTGGIGSFMLQMMVISFLQHRAREEYNNFRRSIVMNLGCLLLEFFELYGIDFNYYTTGISVRNDGRYFPKGAKNRVDVFFQPSRLSGLAIENPIFNELTSSSQTLDVGRCTFRMNQIQRSFELAFRMLLAHVSSPIIPAVSILASILPSYDDLRVRAVYLEDSTYMSLDEDDDEDEEEGEQEDGQETNDTLSKPRNKRNKKNSKKKDKRKLKPNSKANNNVDGLSNKSTGKYNSGNSSRRNSKKGNHNERKLKSALKNKHGSFSSKHISKRARH